MTKLIPTLKDTTVALIRLKRGVMVKERWNGTSTNLIDTYRDPVDLTCCDAAWCELPLAISLVSCGVAEWLTGEDVKAMEVGESVNE